MEKIFFDKMKYLSEKIHIMLNEEQIEKFYEYMNLLLEWNEKINLTAIVEQNDIILKHFIDSLTILPYIGKDKNIVDMGTGAGFPGIPLSIAETSIRSTLVDSLNKRINFLNEVKEKINLKNIQTIHARAEEFGQNKLYREKFEIATSRAVANLSVLVEYLLPLVKVGGKVICMKGQDINEEVEQAKVAINELGGSIVTIDEFYLPETEMKRNIVVIEKNSNTPKRYPRKPGLPSKQPIK